jgi:carboxypeptidase Taq
MVKLQKEKAEHLGYEDKPYDALLDLFEPGMTTEKINKIFAPVKERLTNLAQKIRQSSKQVDDSVLHKDYPEDKQYELSLKLLEAMGYDFKRGREDKSAHPFTTSFHPTDTRVTIRFDENDLASSVCAAIHEGGHALYEQGLDPREFGNPLGQSISSGIHESQSRLWENLVGRSKAFWKYWLPKIKEHFPENLNEVNLEKWYKAFNKVEPSLIRVEADEVYYNLHILLRFEIEDRLINGDLDVSELPKIWDNKMKDYIGIKPENDAQGMLQDIHWSWGQFGYFPTYSLGNFYSVQIFNATLKDIPDLYEQMEHGKLLHLKKWLNQNVHQKGRSVKVEELIMDLCGEAPRSEPFTRYIEKKYSEIYEL